MADKCDARDLLLGMISSDARFMLADMREAVRAVGGDPVGTEKVDETNQALIDVMEKLDVGVVFDAPALTMDSLRAEARELLQRICNKPN